MVKKKEITNEDLLKKIVELQKKVEENNKVVVPYIPFQPVVVQPCHHHYHCWQCQPHQFYPYYYGGLQSTTIVGTSSTGNLLNQYNA